MDFGSKRGLRKFINDLRACTIPETENARVQKELANVRQKFGSAKTLKSYDKKKYVWKLVYIFMLGYEVDFGHMEAVNLASSANAGEKRVGYLALGVLLSGDSELAKLVVNTVRTDLQSGDPTAQALALNFLGNVGGKDLCASLARETLQLAESPEAATAVRKKAVICVSDMLTHDPDLIAPEDVIRKLLPELQQTYQLGLGLSVLALLLRAAARDPGPFAGIVPAVIDMADKIVVNHAVPKEYMYHGVPCPFLQVKLFRLLQLFEFPSDAEPTIKIVGVLNKVLGTGAGGNNANSTNASFSVLIEAVNLVTHYGETLDPGMVEVAVAHLAQLIALPDANIRCLSLASMSKLALAAQRTEMVRPLQLIRKHQATVRASLDDADDTIRRKAVDLMFSMCHQGNAREVVKELLDYLGKVHFSLKAETVLKIAILAERHASDPRWYLDTVLLLIETAGDFVSDDIWFRAVQIVTNKEELHFYAAQQLHQALQRPHVHETTVKVGAYVLGEFGYLLAQTDPAEQAEGFVPVPAMDLFETINQHFAYVGNPVRSMILHAFAKLAHVFPAELHEEVAITFDAYRDAPDAELQQRACEYFGLVELAKDKREAVLEPMPHYPEERLTTALSTQASDHAPPAVAFTATTAAASTGGGAVGPASPAARGTVSDEDEDEDEDDNEVEGAGKAAAADLLGLGSSVPTPAAPTAQAQASSENARAAGSAEERFRRVLTEAKGLLHQDDALQIGVQHQYQGANGKLMLFFGNKSSAPISDLAITFSPPEGLALRSAQLEAVLAPGAQGRQSLALACAMPFDGSPGMSVRFSCAGQQRSLSLKLPTTVCSFASPVTFGTSDFEARWAAMAGQQQASFTKSGSSVDAIVSALRGLNLSATPSEDLASIAAACTVQTTTLNPQTGQPAVVGCLVRVVMTAKAFNLTVRGVNEKAVQGLKQAAAHVLSR